MRESPAIIGRIKPVLPHKCEPGKYEDPERGTLWANNAEPGTLWSCTCGEVYIKECFDGWGFPSDYRTNESRWRRLKGRERRRVLRTLGGDLPVTDQGAEASESGGGS